MTEITSIRHPVKFYLALVGFVSFWLVMALLIGTLHNQAISSLGNIVMLLASAGLAFMAVYTITSYYKNAPNIVVTPDTISLNNDTYYWKDLEKIEMTGKRSFRFLGERKEAMSLKFKGEKERYVFDDMYENSPAIKSFIAEITGNYLQSKESVTSAEIGKFNSGEIKFYKGYQLLCIDGIALWIFCAGALYSAVMIFIIPQKKTVLWMPVVFISFFLSVFSSRMYYFGLSDNQLFIRNHNFFWIKRMYRMTDIKEVVFEQRSKLPVTLRIINNDFTSKTYPATTLWSKTWLQLKADLESKGIKVRNECVYYEPFEFKFFND